MRGSRGVIMPMHDYDDSVFEKTGNHLFGMNKRSFYL